MGGACYTPCARRSANPTCPSSWRRSGPARGAVILDLAPGMEPFQFLQRLRATVPGRSATVLVWMSEELTAQGRAQLEASAEAVVLKSQSGTAALLEELAECLSASDGQAGRAVGPEGQPVKEGDIR